MSGTLPTEQPLLYEGLVAETVDPLDLPYHPTFEELNQDVGIVSADPQSD